MTNEEIINEALSRWVLRGNLQYATRDVLQALMESRRLFSGRFIYGDDVGNGVDLGEPQAAIPTHEIPDDAS
jgi:hypothetical protein